jgi:hypothetical protein
VLTEQELAKRALRLDTFEAPAVEQARRRRALRLTLRWLAAS